MLNKNKLTQGSIFKSLLSLSLPIIFANLLQTAYQLTDTFWVGRLGSVAVAAVSISFPIIFLIVSLGGGLAIAGTILVAHAKGREDQKAIDHITSQTFLIVTIISVILAGAGFLLAPTLIHLMGAASAVAIAAITYVRLSFVGMVFVFIYMVFQSLMRGIGDVKTPMYIVFGAVALNLILDPLFIFGFSFMPALGVAGAALATLCTQALAALVGVVILIRGKHQLQLHLDDLKLDLLLSKEMFKLGFPASIEQSTRALGITVMTFLVASFGTLTLAAYGIGSRILSFIIIPALGFSMATSTLVGQNIGAGKVKRAEKIVKLSALTGFIILSLVGCLVFVFASQLVSFFIPGDLATIKSSSLFIKIMAPTFGFIGLQMALNGAFRGAGKTIISMSLSIISLWLLRFPLAYFLSNYTALSEIGIWLAFPIANIITAIIASLWFLTGSWQHNKFNLTNKLIKETSQETIVEETWD